MREILFRGKRVDNGEWVEGYFVEQDNPEYHTYIIKGFEAEVDNRHIDIGYFDIVEVIPKTVGQYTGFTDKNGNKIFEGDIFCFCNEDNEYTNYEVMWFTSKWVVIMCGANTADDLDLFFCERAVAIGNIHDNSELMEESK